MYVKQIIEVTLYDVSNELEQSWLKIKTWLPTLLNKPL